ncbi:MAG: hypothetical protein NT061_09140 [Spirochaetes bacterium]|nr:hypothetical protein [Spirochaetota bacterium]
MGNARAGIRISKKAFLTSFLVLLALMAGSGLLGILVPSGCYERVPGSSGLQVMADSYHETEKATYPVWRWLSAPVEVLFSEDGLQAIVIILFIMIVGGSFAILDAAKALKEAVAIIATMFSSRRYLLLAAVTFFFMTIGALLGIFEETIPLVPVAIALAASLGWDIYVGLGMSILATGFGFSAAIANPFSIGTAQRLSGLPLFSGAGFRVLVFISVFGLYYLWLSAQARRSEAKAAGIGEPVDLAADKAAEAAAADASAAGERNKVGSVPPPHPERGALFFGISTIILVLVILFVSLTRSLADYSMPIIALVFLISGFGSGLVSGLNFKRCLSSFLSGVGGILPGVVLILMAMAVKHIIVSGGIMDTILHAAAGLIGHSSGYKAAVLIYLFVLGMNFFIGSATAKAFLLMPILAPLADLAGISRQIAVQAFAFGDGFSNMIYPTNAVLLIALGVAGLSWPAWFKRTWALQAATFILTMGLLILAVFIGYA